MAASNYIVQDTVSNTLYRMKGDDYRFDTKDYKTITKITKLKAGTACKGTNRGTVCNTDAGDYVVFCDWSALPVTADHVVVG